MESITVKWNTERAFLSYNFALDNEKIGKR